MALDQVQTTQMQFGQTVNNRQLTAFSPPGIVVEAAKYPVLMAGVLASTEPSEFLSIYDHPEAWGGLDRDAILKMRKRLFRFTFPIDARSMQPRNIVDTLQTIALSVSPVAIEIETSHLPLRKLSALGGQLPASPCANVKSIDIVSDPEVSQVAKRITEQDIPAADAAWKLLDYEYTLDQVARLMSVGLLGKLDSRRFVPTRGAYKAIIDGFVSRSLIELTEKPVTTSYRLGMTELFGDNFTVLAQPGEPQVDYLRLERTVDGLDHGASIQGIKNHTTDSKTSVFADHARFSGFTDIVKRKESAHLTVFHFSRNSRNNILGPWVVRAGVRAALEANQIELDTKENALMVLKSVLAPDISVWTQNDPLLDNFGGAYKVTENISPSNLI
jgi:hypothetical protein